MDWNDPDYRESQIAKKWAEAEDEIDRINAENVLLRTANIELRGENARLIAEVERLKGNQITPEAIQRVAELHREIDNLRAENEALRKIGYAYRDRMREKVVEVKRVQADVDTCSDVLKISEQKRVELEAENEALRKCCAQRGARMQIMLDWINRNPQWMPWTNWDAFVYHRPEAATWFDADGVPVEDAARQGYKQYRYERDNANHIGYSDRKRIRELEMKKSELHRDLKRAKSPSERWGIESQIIGIDRQIEQISAPRY